MPAAREARPGWLGGLRSALLPSLDALQAEIDERLSKIPTRLNQYGFDRFGMCPETMRSQLISSVLAYRYYFRVESFGIENIPPGGVLLISNHAGQLPFDGAMLGTCVLMEAEPPRVVRAMGEYWIPQLPFVSIAAERGGNQVGTPENCRALLEAGECVMVFPEGVRGMNKLYRDRYRLQRFGLGFMRLALDCNVPIVPVGIVGSEEQQPGIANLKSVANLFGMPALPITLGFPWLGPLGLLPLPVRYRIHFGEPLHFEGEAGDEDAVIQEKVDRVRGEIDGLLRRGRELRRGIFT